MSGVACASARGGRVQVHCIAIVMCFFSPMFDSFGSVVVLTIDSILYSLYDDQCDDE